MTNDNDITPETAAPNPGPVPAEAAPATAPVQPEPSALAPAPAPAHHRRWPMWVLAGAIALVIFGAGVRVGFGVANRFGAARLRAGFAAGAIQGARGTSRGGFGQGGRGFGGGPGFRR